MRWAWLKKTEPHRPWASLPIQIPDQINAFFSVAVVTEVGNGNHTLFWTDRWIHGQSIADLAPRLLEAIPLRRVKRRTVREALTDHSWLLDIKGACTVGVIVDFLHLWEVLYNFELEPNVEDVHIWRLSNSRQYSVKSAYEGFFLGSTQFGPYERIWKSWAPPKCRFFLWLVAHNRCWTADRLARRGLPHPEKCPFCDQEEETINHLLVSCVFARQFWYYLLRQVGLHSLSPQPSDVSFDSWWDQASGATSGLIQKGLNSLIVGAWTLWNHRNRCVFYGIIPSLGVHSSLLEKSAGCGV